MEEMRMIMKRYLEEVANQKEEDIENQRKQRKQRTLRGVKQRQEKVKEGGIENKIITVLFL